MAAANLNNLGNRVSTREISWMDMAIRAWGSEFYAPDRGVYEFSGSNSKDSTDKFRTGLYGVEVEDYVIVDDGYPDMRTALSISDVDYSEVVQETAGGTSTGVAILINNVNAAIPVTNQWGAVVDLYV